jgi:N-ethylmaleimide reductase
MSDSNPLNTFTCLVKGLGRLGIGYVHLVEAVGRRPGATDSASHLAPFIRKSYHGTLVLNGGYDTVTGNEAIRTHYADLISFGPPFLSKSRSSAPFQNWCTAEFRRRRNLLRR